MLLLTAINAKYIHSNLAVYCLKAYAQAHPCPGMEIELAEYTINHNRDAILQNIYEKKPEVLAFSCYIWNIEYVLGIAKDYKKLCPDIPILVGGPEVSYDAENVLRKYPFLDIVMMGEGEKTLSEYLLGRAKGKESLANIKGIAYRVAGKIQVNDWRETLELDEVPFPYATLEQMENRIIYYETSRGCPYSCSYCLSSIDKSVRFRSLDKVFPELDFFFENKVPKVKFVDRTFNCRHDHAYAIWKYVKEHDNGITNFHFEISADLLREEDFELFADMRPGLIQLEIGVQTTNEKTIRAINRKMDLVVLQEAVKKVHESGNIHQHLDLIAGLPYEDYESFQNSFNEVFAMEPDQLQLGFLKVLKGSYMGETTEENGILYHSEPPYEVLCTKWLSYDDMIRLKGVEDMVEVYYNSFQFFASVKYIVGWHKSPFDFFRRLSHYYKKKGIEGISQSRYNRYIILQNYFVECCSPGERDKEIFSEVLTYDFYLRENAGNAPSFAAEITKKEKDWIRAFFEEEERCERYVHGYKEFSLKQKLKMLQLRPFSIDMEKLQKDGICEEKRVYVLFDYRNRNVLNHSAHIESIPASVIDNF